MIESGLWYFFGYVKSFHIDAIVADHIVSSLKDELLSSSNGYTTSPTLLRLLSRLTKSWSQQMDGLLRRWSCRDLGVVRRSKGLEGFVT